MGAVENRKEFDGQLCPKYLYKKLLESDNFFIKLQSKMLGMFFP